MPRVCGHGRSRRDRRQAGSAAWMGDQGTSNHSLVTPEVSRGPQSRTLIGFPLDVYGWRPVRPPGVLRGVAPEGDRDQEFWVVGPASPCCAILVPA